jgi:hypothetical protein
MIYLSKNIAATKYEVLDMVLYKYYSMSMFSWHACIAKLVIIPLA